MPDANRASGAMKAFSLALIVALLAAVVLASGAAEAQRGGGGRGGGGGGKPSGVSKPSSEAKQSPSAKSGEKGASSGVYGPRHGSLSNFFLWAWLFHDLDDDDYEEEYGETNAGLGGWAIIGVGALGVWFLFRNLRRRSIR